MDQEDVKQSWEMSSAFLYTSAEAFRLHSTMVGQLKRNLISKFAIFSIKL